MHRTPGRRTPSPSERRRRMQTVLPSPQGMAYLSWTFDRPPLDDLFFDVEILIGDEPYPGRYFQLFQGRIGGAGFDLGFQTDVFAPGAGGQGKGLVFSRWQTCDSADAE